MKKFLGTAAVLAIIVYGVFLVLPQNVPLLDARRELLAETPRQGYCAGVVFGETRGLGSIEGMANCLEENGRDNEKDLDQVQKSFCEGFYQVTTFPVDVCMSEVTARQFWPTLKGRITNSWNRAFPYPGVNALDAVSNSGNRASEDERMADPAFVDPTDR